MKRPTRVYTVGRFVGGGGAFFGGWSAMVTYHNANKITVCVAWKSCTVRVIRVKWRRVTHPEFDTYMF